MADLTQPLKEFGLAENQAKIYLAGLELGPTTVLSLARKSGVKRTTIYTIVEEMIRRGFFTTSFQKGKKVYIAEDPEGLLNLAEEKKKILADNLPELKSIYNLSPVKPKIKFYEGVESMKRIVMDIRMHNIPYYHVDPNQEAMVNLIGKKFANELVARSDRMKMKVRVITDRNPWAYSKIKESKNPNREHRVIPEKYEGLLARQYVTGNRVILIILKKEPITIVIEDKDFAKMQKMLFDALWKISKKE